MLLNIANAHSVRELIQNQVHDDYPNAEFNHEVVDNELFISVTGLPNHLDMTQYLKDVAKEFIASYLTDVIYLNNESGPEYVIIITLQ